MAIIRQTKQGFNKTVTTNLLSTGPVQSMIQISSANKKVLQGISASYFESVASPVNTNQYTGRLIVCTGNLPENDEGLSILSLPINNVVTMNYIGRIIFDKIITGSDYIDFSNGITVLEGDTLNIILGFGWKNGESLLSPGGCMSYLSVLGKEIATDEVNSFPYVLR